MRSLCFGVLTAVFGSALATAQPLPSPYAVTRLTDDSEVESHPDWSPDGTWIAFDSSQGISVFAVAGGTKTVLFPAGSQPVWSPGGAEIAFIRTDAPPYRVWLLPGGGGTPTSSFVRHDLWEMRWAPDGSYLATYAELTSILRGFILHPPGDELYEVISFGSLSTHVQSFDWTTDSQSIIVGGHVQIAPDKILIVDLQGEVLSEIADPPSWIYSLRTSPDGTTVLFSSANAIWTVPISGGEPSALWTNPAPRTSGMLQLAWAPDGRRIVFNSDHEGTVDLYLIDLDAPVPVRPVSWGNLKTRY